MMTFIKRYADKIADTLSCFDRVVITGTLHDICHAPAMARHLTAKGIRLFDCPHFAQPFREQIHEHAERLARENELEIDFMPRKDFERRAGSRRSSAKRGDHPCLVGDGVL